MVAVQPVLRHPFDVARAISSFSFQYGRQVDLNPVTGGFAGHLHELGDALDHDRRYLRLIEYGQIIDKLLAGGLPVTHHGEFYTLNRVKLTNPLPTELTSRTYVSGSSEACVAAQRMLGATRLSYPRFIGDYAATPGSPCVLRGNGIRLGIIARESGDDAWRVAHERFPIDHLGEQLHNLAAGQVGSRWHQSLSADAQRCAAPRDGYWLYPSRMYQTFCPYLVGGYQEVAQLPSRYLHLGVTALILDVPRQEDDLHHAGMVLRLAERLLDSWWYERTS